METFKCGMVWPEDRNKPLKDRWCGDTVYAKISIHHDKCSGWIYVCQNHLPGDAPDRQVKCMDHGMAINIIDSVQVLEYS